MICPFCGEPDRILSKGFGFDEDKNKRLQYKCKNCTGIFLDSKVTPIKELKASVRRYPPFTPYECFYRCKKCNSVLEFHVSRKSKTPIIDSKSLRKIVVINGQVYAKCKCGTYNPIEPNRILFENQW